METVTVLVFCTGVMGGIFLGAVLFIGLMEYIKRRINKLN